MIPLLGIDGTNDVFAACEGSYEALVGTPVMIRITTPRFIGGIPPEISSSLIGLTIQIIFTAEQIAIRWPYFACGHEGFRFGYADVLADALFAANKFAEAICLINYLDDSLQLVVFPPESYEIIS